MPNETAAKDYSNLYIPAAIVIAGLIVGVSLVVALKPATGGSGGAPQIAVDVKKVNIEGDPYIGRVDAPVTLAYWSDYQCPYCKAVEVGGIPQIPIEPALPLVIKEYVDTGKVKIVFKDYPFLSEDSVTAGLYGRAMWNLYPTKYLEWREAMYRAQDEEHGGFGNEASILILTKKIKGVDANKVKADVAANTDAYTAKMDADKAEGTSFGISGTPGFITGKILIPGAAEFSSFKTAIDGQL